MDRVKSKLYCSVHRDCIFQDIKKSQLFYPKRQESSCFPFTELWNVKEWDDSTFSYKSNLTLEFALVYKYVKYLMALELTDFSEEL